MGDSPSQQNHLALKQGLFSTWHPAIQNIKTMDNNGGWAVWNDINMTNIKQDAKAASNTEIACLTKTKKNMMVVWNDHNFTNSNSQCLSPKNLCSSFFGLQKFQTKNPINKQLLPLFFGPRDPIRSCPTLKCCEAHHGFLPRIGFRVGATGDFFPTDPSNYQVLRS